MEQYLRKRRVVLNEDMISELPDALILQILSLLPTKNVISTSVLSKRWRSLWKLVHKLEFDAHNQKIRKFSENVTRFLLSHKAPVLDSFHLRVRGTRRCDPMDIGIWTGILFARHVRELELNLCLYEAKFRLTISFFSSNTLETLKLQGTVLVDVPSPICMKSLTTLHLKCVSYKDGESLRNLLSSFPNLEHLVVRRAYHNGVVNFNIVAPSLKTLSIKDFFDQNSKGRYVINAPSLKYLNIKGSQGYKFCLIENASELVEANISDVSDIANEMFLGSLKSAKRLSLSLSPLKIKCPTGVIFCQLVYLEMDTHRAEWWNLLTLMLDSSPKLQVLKLIDSHQQQPLPFIKQPMKRGEYWNQPKYVPECLLSHLEIFVWKRFNWERKQEKEVATYIIKNARRLKRATLSTRPIESKEHKKLEERCKILKELDGLIRASDSSCHLVFESENDLICA